MCVCASTGWYVYWFSLPTRRSIGGMVSGDKFRGSQRMGYSALKIHLRVVDVMQDRSVSTQERKFGGKRIMCNQEKRKNPHSDDKRGCVVAVASDKGRKQSRVERTWNRSKRGKSEYISEPARRAQSVDYFPRTGRGCTVRWNSRTFPF